MDGRLFRSKSASSDNSSSGDSSSDNEENDDAKNSSDSGDSVLDSEFAELATMMKTSKGEFDNFETSSELQEYAKELISL
ncbi:1536_t:CDS:2 [Entrophospora sp. SA101]|nr:1536_t:CDS:2 [Entrophospora sp. SA101]